MPPTPDAAVLAKPIACDIFCTVVDNFGDIGVCWRLATQLAHEHGWQLRLIVNDLHTFARLVPAVDPTARCQHVAGIAIEHWGEPVHVGDTLAIADVVVEAFGCELPAEYVAAMTRRERAPVWINLEYLSAEDWVADFHQRSSPHPRHALFKSFFFPGLGPGTGGVLKEAGLDARRETFEASAEAREAWWQGATGGPVPAREACVISLFAYENPALGPLLEQWRDGDLPVVLLVPEDRICPGIAAFFGLERFGTGSRAKAGRLSAHGLAFVGQPDYDDLLWASALNFVRGEDSFVRAQWARKPFVWHIYPQGNDAHLPKLDAALAHLTAGLPEPAREAAARFWHAWNGAGTPDWADFLAHRAAFQARAGAWAGQLAAVGDLAGNLAKFTKTQLK
ncbi:MAG: elongation factor P maturation arginine rhamnosyltransferase EarP [Burkholderia sp.]